MKNPLVVVLGQTASGKTALALELAERFNGEIICADSRTVYRGMDIGTAKPTAEEQSKIPHHILNIVDPNTTFSAAEFKKLANSAIADITSRGKLPIMAGGTGLFIDAVLFDFQFGAGADQTLRAELQTRTIEELQAIITERGYDMPENRRNKRYLIRTIEREGVVGSKSELRPNTLVLGLQVDPDVVRQRVETRVSAMLAAGFVDEVRGLLARYDESAPGFRAPGYKAFIPYVRGEISLAEATARFVQNDTHLAKRQRTWFRRNHCIQWVSDRSKAVDLTTTFLNK